MECPYFAMQLFRIGIRVGTGFFKDTLAFALKFFELTAEYGPQQNNADQEHQRHGKRNQKIEHVHRQTFAFQGRKALPTTHNELTAIPIAAKAGVSNPPAASGSTDTL